MTSGRLLFFVLCSLGFSFCQHKMLTEVSLLMSGCAVVLSVVASVDSDPACFLETAAAHVSQ